MKREKYSIRIIYLLLLYAVLYHKIGLRFSLPVGTKVHFIAHHCSMSAHRYGKGKAYLHRLKAQTQTLAHCTVCVGSAYTNT